jgi:uncharacterized membrane protein YheB (UPF0754 family)
MALEKSSKDVSQETITDFVKKAVNLLLQKQISETMILSSYKINTVLKNYMGVEFKIDRIGRSLARLAKQNKLKRIPTKIPKYELRVSKFKGFQLPD